MGYTYNKLNNNDFNKDRICNERGDNHDKVGE